MEPMTHALSRPKKTLRDREALPHDVRTELLDGELYVTPSPGWTHQRVVLRMATVLWDHVEPLGWGRAAIAPLDVHLPTGDLAQPDVLLIRKDAPCEVRTHVHGAPTVVIEVLSPAHPERDLVVKRTRYALAGIAEYWIVDPEQAGIEVLVLADNGAYRCAGWFTGARRIVSPALPALRLAASEVFAGA